MAKRKLRKRELPANFDEVRREAMLLWKQRCEQYLGERGDQGSCVLGAGIVHEDAPYDWPDWDKDYIVHASDITGAQGSLVWEQSVDEVVAWLRNCGVPARYHAGRMD